MAARGFLEFLKDELTHTNIDIINIYPGGMKTSFWNDSRSGYNIEAFMKPQDVAQTIAEAALSDNLWVSEININRLRQI
ncbi:hypothetical protein SAMN02745975_02683 [Geosporobacter subterraneus DSM 17957]|uniref:Short chain dehydrogenase n=1 Tax=Geosporobacter subterraneus DSM 17957 TaxID=1121919 RepID=A0A1M6LHA7_9FIRM|nr:hypothetical protein [Geosporobacter subterraneus]SHJ70592.1 hypothetical protein SAMN02745975_02683 [Geosporobacter subterraneus DSM 17957]